MSTRDDRFSNNSDGTSGRDAAPKSEAPQVGKISLIQLQFGPNARQPTEPNKRSLTEQLVPIQLRGDGPDDAARAEAPPSGGGGAPLPPDVRARMEAALGGKFAGVRVHVSSYASAIGARAFTRGTDLFFAPGAYDPTSPQGLQLTLHCSREMTRGCSREMTHPGHQPAAVRAR